MNPDAWSGMTAVERVTGGNRNEVWRATRAGESFAVRRSRRCSASLAWELRLVEFLHDYDVVVPTVEPTDSGEWSDGGIVVQRWIGGRPPQSVEEWQRVARELGRLHDLTRTYPQRPGCCCVTELEADRTSVDADLDAVPEPDRTLIVDVFGEFENVPTGVVHGDPGPSNIRILPSGRVGLLDWDESRVDVTWHDLSNLGVQVLDDVDHRRATLLSHAWEGLNAWTAEPEYARHRLAELRRLVFDPTG